MRVDEFDVAAQLQLRDLLLAAHVGWRFLVIAAEASAERVCAHLLGNGAIEACQSWPTTSRARIEELLPRSLDPLGDDTP